MIGAIPAFSQVSVNSVEVPKAKELKFIDEVAFTPLESTQIELTSSSRSLGTNNHIQNSPDLSGSMPSPSADIIEQCGSLQFKYATMLDVPVEAISMTNIYSFINDWMGTRYRMGGTTKDGIDCSAFTGSLLLGCYALAIPRTAREQHRVASPVSREELKEGDLVFFNTTGGVSHVGVYLTNNYFVHSSSSQGVTISNLNDSYYAKRFISGGRMTAGEEAVVTEN